ncbi:MAG: carbohydrate ABC transporter permease [Firmicutes bacterium]|nr:carbohydrate ABC transporter permease [Bacillota bacterium]
MSARTSIKQRDLIRRVLSHFVLITFGLVFILPLVTMVTTALKPDQQIFAWPPVWIPSPLMWSNFPRALTFVPMLVYAKNTVTITALSVIGVTLSSPLVAYGLARIDWPERNILFIIIISTMMIPYQVTMIPVYLLFNAFGWTNTYLPLIVPSFFGSPFFIFLLRQFFMTIPQELSDAARIDGCTEFGIFRRVILPLAKPALAVVALFQFIWTWNDFLGPLIYLKDQTLYTLSLGLQQFQSGYQTEWALLMAAATMMTVPIIVLFFFTQRTFIQGITLTGIKG